MNDIQKRITLKYLKYLRVGICGLGVLFILELILGFNGTLLIIGNMGIRKILFSSLTFLSLLFILGIIIRYGVKEIIKQLTFLDYIVAGFLVTQIMWIIIIPICNEQSIKLAIKEALSLSTLILYFPVGTMIKMQYIKWDRVRELIKYSVIILAVIHIILYIGETIVGDATFAISFFESIGRMTFGYSKRPLIMMPMNYIRIIYPASIFLLVPFYYILQQRKWSWKSVIYYGISLVGIMTTITKSLFMGCIVGLVCYILGIFTMAVKDYKFLLGKRFIRFGVLTVLFVFIVDVQVMGGYVTRRINTTFEIKSPLQQQEEVEQYKLDHLSVEEQRDLDELAGTERSNYTRIEQSKKLLQHWSNKPWLGYGYGSYVEDYLRAGGETPYSYEMFAPAMLMKLGIVGISIWIGFIIYLLICMIKVVSVYKERAIALIYLTVALGVSTQFNPFLLNAMGMSIVLFILLELSFMMNKINK